LEVQYFQLSSFSGDGREGSNSKKNLITLSKVKSLKLLVGLDPIKTAMRVLSSFEDEINQGNKVAA
jgi:hypothetical protein